MTIRNLYPFKSNPYQVMYNYLIPIFCLLCYYLGINKLIRIWRRLFSRKKKIVILGYHRVQHGAHNPFRLTISLKNFAAQMDYIRKSYEIASLNDLPSLIENKRINQDKVIITFDDGYRDNFLNAYPVLKKHQIRATIFVTTASIGSNQGLWNDRVFDIVRNVEFNKLNNGFFQKYPSDLSNILRSLTQDANQIPQSYRDLILALKPLPKSIRNKITSELSKASINNSQIKNNNSMLSRKEIYTLWKNGISIGSHSVTHEILTNLSEDEIHEEIFKSKSDLEQSNKFKVNAFSYPNGKPRDFNKKIQHYVKKAGYECACTAIKGTNDIYSDLFALKRWMIYDMPIHVFATKLSLLFTFG